MRNDPSDHATWTNAEAGRSAVIACYAAFGLSLAFLVALLVVDRHETTNAATDTAAVQASSFGIEELVDLLASEPTVMLPLAGPRPGTRAEPDPKRPH